MPDPLLWMGVPRPPGGRAPALTHLVLHRSPLHPSSHLALRGLCLPLRAQGHPSPGPGKGGPGLRQLTHPALHLGLSREVARHPLPQEAPVSRSVTSGHPGDSLLCSLLPLSEGGRAAPQGHLTPSVASSPGSASVGAAGDQSTGGQCTGAPRPLTSAEKSPWCSRSRVSPALVEYGTSWSPRCRAITVTWSENSGSEPQGHLPGARARLTVCQGSRGPRPPSPCLCVGLGEALPLCCSLQSPGEDPGGRG